ncbi:MAG: methylated-DNA--protein-cysteine methyltransferase [Chrysothrix sp. TS-e1954]|nr:MAG: methylated-DNA--protein-cysteine methyltransferase [Chrysothrix sp. TS-e1954]
MATRTHTSTTTSSPLDPLRTRYTYLTKHTLPALARSRAPCQPTWPVHLDHCFMRIILDNAVGVSGPWGDVVKAPATRNMTRQQLESAIALGEKLVDGTADLRELDERSLSLRGTTKQGKKATEEEQRAKKNDRMREWRRNRRREQMDAIWAGAAVWDKKQRDQDAKARDLLIKMRTEPSDEPLDQARNRIALDKSMTPFRKRTLLLLTQVPRGHHTTYKAMAAGISRLSDEETPASGCARAIGFAMRNNPFAPTVPCHRVLAADGKIGGFGGDWGEEGRFVGEKRRLLKEEGVRFDGKGKVVGAPWEGFETDMWIKSV